MTRFNRLSSLYAAFFILGLIAYSPTLIEKKNLIGESGDSLSYMAHATSIAFGKFPSYANEFANTFPGNYSLGPGISAAPFVFAFSLVDRAKGDDIVQRRTESNLVTGYAPFGFTVATQVIFIAGIWFLWSACRLLNGGAPSAAVFLATVGGGVPFYIYRLPVTSHICEFSTISFLLYLVAAARSGAIRYGPKLYALGVAGGIAVFLSRYNDILFSAILPLMAFRLARRRVSPDLRRDVLDSVAWLPTLVLIVLAVRRLVYYLAKTGWNSFWMPGHLKTEVFHWKGLVYYFERTLQVFFWIDWGMIYTIPLTLFGIYLLYRMLRPAWLAVLLIAPLAVNLAMSVSWSNQGAGYAYRYFDMAAAPLAAVGLSLWFADPDHGKRRVRNAALLGLYPMIAGVIFDVAPNLHLDFVDTWWERAWTNPTFVLNVLLDVFWYPLRLSGYILRSGAFGWFFYDLSVRTFIKWFSLVIIAALAFVIARWREKRCVTGDDFLQLSK